MIPHRVEGIRQVREDRFAIVNHRRGLAMHQPARADDLRAERLADTLMTEAHAENRHLARHLAQDAERDTSLGRRARSRRDYDCARPERAHSGDVDRVVALHNYFGAEFAEILHDIVGKRIVVIDHHQANCFSVRVHHFYLFAAASKSRAAWSARTIARALFTDSSNSAPGSESATTPPPAWI